jgi:hypothetical protein
MARHPQRSLSAHVLLAALVAGLVRPPVSAAMPTQFVPGLVSGATGPSVAVVVVGLDLKARAQAGALEGEAEAALARSGRLTLVTAHDAFNPDAAKKRAQALATAREKLALGKKALDDLDNVKATGDFVDALALLKQADTTQVARDYLDALVLKAASHATGGEVAPAKKGIDAALAFDPHAEFSPTFFPPDLVKYAEAQRKGATAAKGELLVRTEPSGARVWVDGAYVGPSPATASNLGPGKHFVAAAQSGSALAQAELPPGEGQLSLEPAELSAEFTRATARISSDPEGPGRDQGARELAKALGVDQVLLVIARKSLAGDQLDLIAERVDAKDGHNWSYRALTIRADAAAGFFDALLLKDTLRSGRDPVTNFKGGGGGGVRTSVAIGLLGLGAAALVTGGVFGFMASNDAAAFKQTAQTDVAKSNQLRSAGQSYAIVADLSFLVGLASAATGTVLLVTNGSGSGGAASADDGAAAKKEEVARRRDAERKASEDRARADDARRKSEADAANTKREDDRRRADDAAATKRADDEKKKADEKRADDEKKKTDDDDGAATKKKLTKKQQQEEEKKRRDEEKRQKDEEARAAAEEKKRQADEAKAKKDDEARAAEEKKRQADEAKAKKGSEPAKKVDEKKADEVKPDEKKSGDDDAARRAAEEKRKKEDDERRRLEEEKRKKDEEEKKKKKDDDDLRNY